MSAWRTASPCDRKLSYPAHPVWMQAQSAVAEVLSAAMIADLAMQAVTPDLQFVYAGCAADHESLCLTIRSHLQFLKRATIAISSRSAIPSAARFMSTFSDEPGNSILTGRMPLGSKERASIDPTGEKRSEESQHWHARQNHSKIKPLLYQRTRQERASLQGRKEEHSSRPAIQDETWRAGSTGVVACVRLRSIARVAAPCTHRRASRA